MKPCPYCAEPIQDSAIKCRYCGSQVQGSPITREWYRRREGKRIAGVCAGLAEEFGISATPLRLAFVLLTLIGGPGLILYIILWLIMPYRDTLPGRIDRRGSALELDDRTPQFLDRG
jgi:phage shock protein C